MSVTTEMDDHDGSFAPSRFGLAASLGAPSSEAASPASSGTDLGLGVLGYNEVEEEAPLSEAVRSQRLAAREADATQTPADAFAPSRFGLAASPDTTPASSARHLELGALGYNEMASLSASPDASARRDAERSEGEATRSEGGPNRSGLAASLGAPSPDTTPVSSARHLELGALGYNEVAGTPSSEPTTGPPAGFSNVDYAAAAEARTPSRALSGSFAATPDGNVIPLSAVGRNEPERYEPPSLRSAAGNGDRNRRLRAQLARMLASEEESDGEEEERRAAERSEGGRDGEEEERDGEEEERDLPPPSRRARR